MAETRRPDGRKPHELRPIRIQTKVLKYPEGSALIEWGETRVLCAVSVEDKVPPFLNGTGRGWVTAEYAMLPRATQQRTPRESTKGKIGGRTHEIQRLIGRALRTIVDLAALGERTLWVDCDVLQADGGTRTASITGAFVAVSEALQKLLEAGLYKKLPLLDTVAAVSVGIVAGVPVLDLNYQEDSSADVDMNFVVTGKGHFIEIQGTAERKPFSQADMGAMTELALQGAGRIKEIQKSAAGLP